MQSRLSICATNCPEVAAVHLRQAGGDVQRAPLLARHRGELMRRRAAGCSNSRRARSAARRHTPARHRRQRVGALQAIDAIVRALIADRHLGAQHVASQLRRDAGGSSRGSTARRSPSSAASSQQQCQRASLGVVQSGAQRASPRRARCRWTIAPAEISASAPRIAACRNLEQADGPGHQRRQ